MEIKFTKVAEQHAPFESNDQAIDFVTANRGLEAEILKKTLPTADGVKEAFVVVVPERSADKLKTEYPDGVKFTPVEAAHAAFIKPEQAEEFGRELTAKGIEHKIEPRMIEGAGRTPIKVSMVMVAQDQLEKLAQNGYEVRESEHNQSNSIETAVPSASVTPTAVTAGQQVLAR